MFLTGLVVLAGTAVAITGMALKGIQRGTAQESYAPWRNWCGNFADTDDASL